MPAPRGGNPPAAWSTRSRRSRRASAPARVREAQPDAHQRAHGHDARTACRRSARPGRRAAVSGRNAHPVSSGVKPEHVLEVEREVEQHPERPTPTARRPRSRRRRRSACGTATGRASAAPARSSATTNSTSSSAAPRSSPTISGLDQPSSLPRISAKNSMNTAGLKRHEAGPVDPARVRVARLRDPARVTAKRRDADRARS